MWRDADIPYWRLSGFYFFYFAFLGAWVPFWNLYLEQELLFDAREIGLLSALVLATKIVGPYLWGWLSDHSGKRMLVIRTGSLFACLSFLGVFWRQDFVTLLVVIACYSFFWNAVLSQFEVVTLAHLKTLSTRYTQIRLWGSIGFIFAVFILGFVFDVLSLRYLPFFLMTFLFGISAFSFFVPDDADGIRQQKENDKTHSSFAQFIMQLKAPGNMVFFLACFLMQFSHGPYYTFYSISLEQLGYSRATIGALWALGVLAEVVLFVYMPRLFKHCSLRFLLLTTLFLTIVRWCMIAFFAQFFVVLFAAQFLHAASFGSFHAVSIEIVRRRFSGSSSGQGQAFYSAISFGAGGAVGALMSGALWPMGAATIFAVAALAVLLAFVLLLVFMPVEWDWGS